MSATTFMEAAAAKVRRPWATVPNLLFALHIILTLMVAWWSAILAAPWPTFPTGRSYSAFMAITPNELYWSTGFGIAAVIGSAGCLAAWPLGRWLLTRRLGAVRMLSACALGTNHGIIALLTVRGNPASTGTGIYLLIAATAYLLMLAEYERS